MTQLKREVQKANEKDPDEEIERERRD